MPQLLKAIRPLRRREDCIDDGDARGVQVQRESGSNNDNNGDERRQQVEGDHSKNSGKGDERRREVEEEYETTDRMSSASASMDMECKNHSEINCLTPQIGGAPMGSIENMGYRENRSSDDHELQETGDDSTVNVQKPCSKISTRPFFKKSGIQDSTLIDAAFPGLPEKKNRKVNSSPTCSTKKSKLKSDMECEQIRQKTLVQFFPSVAASTSSKEQDKGCSSRENAPGTTNIATSDALSNAQNIAKMAFPLDMKPNEQSSDINNSQSAAGKDEALDTTAMDKSKISTQNISSAIKSSPVCEPGVVDEGNNLIDSVATDCINTKTQPEMASATDHETSAQNSSTKHNAKCNEFVDNQDNVKMESKLSDDAKGGATSICDGIEKFDSFPEVALNSLLVSLANACSKALKKTEILSEFLSKPEAAGISKNLTLRQMKLMSSSRKLPGDQKARWWPDQRLFTKIPAGLRETLESIQASAAEAIKVKSAPAKLPKSENTTQLITKKDDPRICTYSDFLFKSVIPELAAGLSAACIDAEQSKIFQASIEKLQTSTKINLESSETKSLLALAIQGHQGTLSDLLDKVTKLIPNIPRRALEPKILLLSERKAYGIRERGVVSNTDTSTKSYWRWEVVNLNLLPSAMRKRVTENRKKLSILSRRFCTASRLLQILEENVDGKHESKIQKMIEIIQKYMREDELYRQKQDESKRKEQLKEEARKSKTEEKDQLKRSDGDEENEEPDVLGSSKKKRCLAPNSMKMTSFFSKKPFSPVRTLSLEEMDVASGLQNPGSSNCPKDQTLPKCPSLPKSTISMGIDDILRLPELERQVQSAHEIASDIRKDRRRKLTSKIDSGKGFIPKKILAGENHGLESFSTEKYQDAACAAAANNFKKKLFQFHGCLRPPYFGTFRKTSSIIGPRRIFARDSNIDYSYDSDDEWEDPGDAESLADSDAGSMIEEEERGCSNGLDYNDGFLVADETAAWEDGSNEANSHESRRKPAITGCVWNQAKDWFSYAIEPLSLFENISSPLLPLKAPLSENILLEIESATGKRKASSQANNVLNHGKSVGSSKKSKIENSSELEKTDMVAKIKNDKKPAEAFPSDQLEDLARAVAGSFLNTSQLVDSFQLEQRKKFAVLFSQSGGGANELRKEASKKTIKETIRNIASREKRDGDSKPRWYVNQSALQLLRQNQVSAVHGGKQ